MNPSFHLRAFGALTLLAGLSACGGGNDNDTPSAASPGEGATA